MPQNDDALPNQQQDLIRQWIAEGAEFDGSDPAAPLASLIETQGHPDPPESYPFPLPITALAFHPDGQQLAVSGYHEVTVWNPESGQLLRRIRNLPQRIEDLAFDTDGSRLAVAGGAPGLSGEAAVVSLAGEDRSEVLFRSAEVVLAVAFSPDGHQLAVAGADNSIRIFHLGTNSPPMVIRQHADWIRDLAFSPDGSLLASASRDRSARAYRTATGELVATFYGHNSPVHAVVFGADGERIVSTGADERIRVWKTGDSGEDFSLPAAGEAFALLSRETTLFSAGTKSVIQLHSLENKKPLRTLEGHAGPVYSLAIHPESGRLASGDHQGTLRLWQFEEGKLLHEFTASPHRSQAGPAP